MKLPRAGTAFAVLIGLIAGLAVAYFSMLISLAGDGWNSSAYGNTSLVGAPIAAYAWSTRGTRVSRRVAILALVLALATDAVLLFQTSQDGSYRAARMLPTGAGFFWATLFLGWQLVALAAVLPANQRPSNQ